MAIAPGRAFGENGEGYMRIALVENEQRLRQAVRNISRFEQDKPIRKAKIEKKTLTLNFCFSSFISITTISSAFFFESIWAPFRMNYKNKPFHL